MHIALFGFNAQEKEIYTVFLNLIVSLLVTGKGVERLQHKYVLCCLSFAKPSSCHITRQDGANRACLYQSSPC
jgi:hypothetical protein